MPLLTCLMRTFPSVMVSLGVDFGPLVFHHTCVLGMRQLLRFCARAIADARHFHTTLAGDLLDRRELLKTVQRREHHVVRIGGAETLRENIGDTSALHDRSYGATGDHTGSRRCRLHENPAGAV